MKNCLLRPRLPGLFALIVAATLTTHAFAAKQTAHAARAHTKAAATTQTRPVTPSYADNPAVQEFIGQMHAQYGFDTDHLTRQFAGIHPNTTVLQAIRPAAVPELQRSWERYRERFINDRRINGGVRFWQENATELARAEAIYDVPAEIITAIIGVETEYGRNMGKFSVLEALATLAFDYPPRAPFFRNELEQYLLMARENGVSPLDIKGSYAGAIGIPQFMPSSQRQFAVDFDGDDRIDLRGSTADAIGSVARFLKMHGWQAKGAIAVPARVTTAPDDLIAAGIKPTFALKELRERGINAAGDDAQPAALIDLVSPNLPTEYWVGFDNFFVITRYNRSSFYAMSVFQLAEAIRDTQSR